MPGIQYLASAAQSNRQAMSAHEALVDQVTRRSACVMGDWCGRT